MIKKYKKVKKKIIKSSKKKSKKKLIKKRTRKRKSKNVKKKKKRKKIDMEDLYRILNKVQLKNKSVTFAVESSDTEVIENIIMDVQLNYEKVEMKTQIVFTVHPTEKKENYEILEIEYLDDEVIEEGQIFP